MRKVSFVAGSPGGAAAGGAAAVALGSGANTWISATSMYGELP